MFPTVKVGSGFSLSVDAQITGGFYVGEGEINAKSMEGVGLYTNYSRGILSSSYSVGLDARNRPSWYFISIGIGKGIPKSLKWSTQTGFSTTGSVHYFRDIDWSN